MAYVGARRGSRSRSGHGAAAAAVRSGTALAGRGRLPGARAAVARGWTGRLPLRALLGGPAAPAGGDLPARRRTRWPDRAPPDRRAGRGHHGGRGGSHGPPAVRPPSRRLGLGRRVWAAGRTERRRRERRRRAPRGAVRRRGHRGGGRRPHHSRAVARPLGVGSGGCLCRCRGAGEAEHARRVRLLRGVRPPDVAQRPCRVHPTPAAHRPVVRRGRCVTSLGARLRSPARHDTGWSLLRDVPVPGARSPADRGPHGRRVRRAADPAGRGGAPLRRAGRHRRPAGAARAAAHHPVSPARGAVRRCCRRAHGLRRGLHGSRWQLVAALPRAAGRAGRARCGPCRRVGAAAGGPAARAGHDGRPAWMGGRPGDAHGRLRPGHRPRDRPGRVPGRHRGVRARGRRRGGRVGSRLAVPLPVEPALARPRPRNDRPRRDARGNAMPRPGW